MRKLIKTKMCCRDFFKVRNSKAVPFIRYSGPFLKWTKEELKQVMKEQGNCWALDARDDINRLYITRKEGGKDSLAVRIA